MISACLIDLYGTLATADFGTFDQVLAERAGADKEAWTRAFHQAGVLSGVGQVTRAELYEIMLRICRIKPTEELIRDLVGTGQEMLVSSGRLYDDALPFLDRLRSRRIATALVSNCGEPTRPFLTALGLDGRFDVTVLSFEVGLIKPSPRIFRYTLGKLGVTGSDALFVDDQAAFCAGAETAGIRAIQLVRDGDLPDGAVRSLLDINPLPSFRLPARPIAPHVSESDRGGSCERAV
jgi:putative hydrolase of the HAD superfamily